MAISVMTITLIIFLVIIIYLTRKNKRLSARAKLSEEVLVPSTTNPGILPHHQNRNHQHRRTWTWSWSLSVSLDPVHKVHRKNYCQTFESKFNSAKDKNTSFVSSSERTSVCSTLDIITLLNDVPFIIERMCPNDDAWMLTTYGLFKDRKIDRLHQELRYISRARIFWPTVTTTIEKWD